MRTRHVRGVAIAVGTAAAVVMPTFVDAAPDTPVAGACANRPAEYSRAPEYGASRTLDDISLTMSDGVVLKATVVLPARSAGAVEPGRFPTSLTITGYSRGVLGGAGGLTRYGYAAMTVDDRGTGQSGGNWDSWGERTQADYTEILDWIVAQPWSDGRVGTTGQSYLGITSLFTAATGHPAVKAVFATIPMGDAYRDIAFAGGQGNVSFIPAWLGLVTALSVLPGTPPEVALEHVGNIAEFQAPMLAEAVLGAPNSYDNEFWRQRSPLEVADRITAPTFIVGGLDDLFQRGAPMLYEALADQTEARLLMGPWGHLQAGSGLPRDGVPATDALLLQWFDQHVMGLDAGAECIPPVTQWVKGLERYETSSRWPAPDLAPARWHLRGDRSLTMAPPSVGEAPRRYRMLPLTGPCSRNTSQWIAGALSGTPCAESNKIEELASLNYTSVAFPETTVVSGPIQADLWITTSREDALVSVSLADIAPDGSSRPLTSGWLIASNRRVDPARSRYLGGMSIQPWHPFTREAVERVTPGEPMLLPVEIFPSSFAIQRGHRLRVTIGPTDLPHAAPPLPQSLAMAGATVHVLSDAAHPSSITLPIRPD